MALSNKFPLSFDRGVDAPYEPTIPDALDLLEAISFYPPGEAFRSPEQFSNSQDAIALMRSLKRRLDGYYGAFDKNDAPLYEEGFYDAKPIPSLPPFLDIVKPTGGVFNPNVDLSRRLQDRLREMISEDLGPMGEELLQRSPLGFIPERRFGGDYGSGEHNNTIRINPNMLQTSPQEVANILKHELTHAYFKENISPESFVHTPTVRKFSGLAATDPSHILTALLGLGASNNPGISRYGNPFDMKRVPQDILDFIPGLFK